MPLTHVRVTIRLPEVEQLASVVELARTIGAKVRLHDQQTYCGSVVLGTAAVQGDRDDGKFAVDLVLHDHVAAQVARGDLKAHPLLSKFLDTDKSERWELYSVILRPTANQGT